MCTCYLPESRREGGKEPGQRKSFRGAVVGYVLDMSAYKVWDIETRARREVPFAFTFIHEGFYPFKNKNDWPHDEEALLPVKFYPSRESILDAKNGRVLTSTKKKRP